MRFLAAASGARPRELTLVLVGLGSIGAGLLLAFGLMLATWQGRSDELVAKPAKPAAPPAAATAAIDAPQVFEKITPAQAATINAAVPVSAAPNPAAAPFNMAGASEADRSNALNCLTLAVYYEAATQPADGQAAVAQVVLNRLRNPHFPKSVCGVVFQGSQLPTGCQFTFTCDGSLLRPPAPALWRGAREIAERALGGYVQKSVGLATHYHTIWVVPYWQSSVLKVGQVGAHVFYRMDGGLGSAASFQSAYGGAEAIPLRANMGNALSQLLGKNVFEPPKPLVKVAVVEHAPIIAPVTAITSPTHAAVEPLTTTPTTVETLNTHDSFFSRPTQTYQHLPMAR